MPRTQTAPPTDAEHEAQVAEQAQIESQVTTDPPAVPTDPDAAGDSSAPGDEQAPEVAVEQATATIKSVNVDEYPIHVGLAQGEYTFENADQTFDVPLEVAEQITYIPQVEVVA